MQAQRLFERIGSAAMLICRFVPMGAFVALLASDTLRGENTAPDPFFIHGEAWLIDMPEMP